MAIELATIDVVSRETAETPWAAVTCLSLLTFLLVGLEFLPVSLLTPIAGELSVSEGQAGLAITVSGVFALITSLFGNGFLSKWDRKAVVLFYTGVLVLSSLTVAIAPNFAVFLAGRALVGVAIGGFWSLSTATSHVWHRSRTCRRPLLCSMAAPRSPSLSRHLSAAFSAG